MALNSAQNIVALPLPYAFIIILRAHSQLVCDKCWYSRDVRCVYVVAVVCVFFVLLCQQYVEHTCIASQFKRKPI